MESDFLYHIPGQDTAGLDKPHRCPHFQKFHLFSSIIFVSKAIRYPYEATTDVLEIDLTIANRKVLRST